MAVREILQLGNPKLLEICDPIRPSDLEEVKDVVKDLHDTLLDFRATWSCGRAIAAPQIGYLKRLVYMHVDNISTVFINPSIIWKSESFLELWDDCMSFPNLLVRLQRHQKIQLSYRDINFQEHTVFFENDLAELLQHECDHLDGILAVSRALDGHSFCLRSQLPYVSGA